MQKFEVDQPFPGPVPVKEGATIELTDSLDVYIQMPGTTKAEQRAFQKSFKWYAYLETNTPVPIALWIFDFPTPHGPVDCSFNTRIVDSRYIDSFLQRENGRSKNMVSFFLLDGKILKAIKTFGLHPEALALFHATISKQMSTDYTASSFIYYVNAMYQYTSTELMQMGTVFKTRRY